MTPFPELPHILFNWWRGDCGMLLDGEEMPSVEERAWAWALVGTYTEDKLAPMLRFMARRRWFSSLGLNAGEFAVWLEDLRSGKGGDE